MPVSDGASGEAL